MLALAATGVEEGLWLRAVRQTQGRGRLARMWESPDGNLHASCLVRPQPGDPAPASLALVAALAVWRAVDALLPGKARIKWPNDLLIGPAKLAGILLERTGDAIVVGIGVNVMAHPDLPDRPATSLWAQGVVDSEAAALCADIASKFNALLNEWRTLGLPAILPSWTAAAHPPGTPLRASLPDKTRVDGRFHRLDSTGALILDLDNGTTRAIHAADIFLL